MSEKQKQPISWKLWVAVGALFVFAVIVFAILGPDAMEGPEVGRPLPLLIDEVDCDRLDLGDGPVKFFCNDGTIWTATPFELGEKVQ